ncbi:MAG: phosphoribosylanthranilate isomerase [Pseudoprimorskyibacter sp.]|nr:phosphoribosylanthranilate isomerase [Pseudoprimorskyibacter sp.]
MTQAGVKICGIIRAEDIESVAATNASYVGFVFFEKSPRNVTIKQASALCQATPSRLTRVALTVDASDAELDAIFAEVPIDMIQLHGTETPERVVYLRNRFARPVMKAVGVADANDLASLDAYSAVADQILVDAKPPKGADLPGGNGLRFDWRLISGRSWSVPWMLAGGLDPATVAEAIRMTGARQVDVSSGVESQPGVKDSKKIARFVSAAQGAIGSL